MQWAVLRISERRTIGRGAARVLLPSWWGVWLSKGTGSLLQWTIKPFMWV